MRFAVVVVVAFVVAVVVASCVDSGSNRAAVDRTLVQQNLLRSLPSDLSRVDASLGPGLVTYVGHRVERNTTAGIVPGQSIRMTHYWRVDRPPGPGWRVFAFVRGAPGTADFVYVDPSDMQLAHPVDAWRSGDIIQNAQDVVIRPDWKSSTATVYLGLVRTGRHRVDDRMVVNAPVHAPVHAGPPGEIRGGEADLIDRAVVAAVLPVDLSKAPPPPGTVYVPRVSAPIAMDGEGLDQGWASAAASPAFQTAEGSPDPVGRTTAKMVWDDQYLYLLIQVADTDIYSPYKHRDEPLWKADAVEVFIDADANRRGYVELQVNPNNAVFDSWFATTRAQPGDPTWDSSLIAAVSVAGTPDRAGDADVGWSAEIAIPWAAVKGRDHAMQVHIPPRIGDRWRMNVVRVDGRAGRKDVAASSWNPITWSDFHALDRMLTVVFADSAGSIAKTGG